jgi:hypothetical protein
MKPLDKPGQLPVRLLVWAFKTAFSGHNPAYVCSGCGLEHNPPDGRDLDGRAHINCPRGGYWQRR